MRASGAVRSTSSTEAKAGTASAGLYFTGKRGELRQRYREGQEDQLGALGLVDPSDRNA